LFVLAWSGEPGRLYTVSLKSNLADIVWMDLLGWIDIPGTGALMSYTNSAPSLTAQFYRLRVRLGPP